MNKERLSFLLSAYVDGQLTPAEKAELEEALLSSAACRAQFWRETKLHDQLRAAEADMSAPVSDPPPLRVLPEPAGGRRTLSLFSRPLTAAAAAVVMSSLCTSAVWAYAGQRLGPKLRSALLLETDFESMDSVPASGIPSNPNEWGGDYCRIVRSEQGVRPRGGGQMLRFLRADNALGEERGPNYVGEAAQTLDLRGLRNELQDGAAQIEITAWFAAAEAGGDSEFRFLVKAAAFRGAPEQAPTLWKDAVRDSMSMVQKQANADGMAGQWLPVTISIPIAPDAEILVFECGVMQAKPRIQEGTAEFPGHYLDDVRVRLRSGASTLPFLNRPPLAR
jgi:hypothetical protein